MKRILISLFIIGLLGFMGFQYFSKPTFTCEFVVEPYIPREEFSHVDDIVKYSIEEHINIISGRENIRNAIQDYRLDELYSVNAITLRKEIANQLEVKQLSGSNKMSVEVAVESEEKAQQIGYAIVNSYEDLLKKEKTRQVLQLINQLRARTRIQEHNVSMARKKLADLSAGLGVKFVDPNERVSSILFSESEPDPKEKLTPEQLTLYSMAQDSYQKEGELLNGLKMNEFMRTIHERLMPPSVRHDLKVTREVSTFMIQRRKFRED